MEEKQKVLSLRKISKSFSGVNVLNDISLDIFSGEVHCLLGENGAGKSTLIKIISGAYTCDSGEIIYLGGKITHNNPHWARLNGINTIYQEIDLIPTLNTAENIFLGNELVTKTGNINRKEIISRSQEILAGMGVSFDVSVPISGLPLAQQQMVSIAKALSLNTNLIIFDEPTAVFTNKEINMLFAIIRTLKKQGKAILYISHHLDEIFVIGDKITVLRDGNHVKTGDISEFDKNSLVNLMVGRDIDLSKRSLAEKGTKELLRLEGIGQNGVVENINLTIHEGEVVGIAGLVGAGRSELARIIVGMQKPDRGEIYYKGKRIFNKSPRTALKKGIAILPEDRKNEGLVLIRSIGENLTYGTISKDYSGWVNWRKVFIARKKLIKEVGVRPPKEKIQVTFLSGGNQQKVVLGKLLGSRSDLLILDEPTRGVDVGAREDIYKIMQRLKSEKKGILMISSDLPEILSQSDRIYIMAKGRIVGEVSATEATEESILSQALRVTGNGNGK